MEKDKDLEACFAAARTLAPMPDRALLDRIAAEGRALQPLPRHMPEAERAPAGQRGAGPWRAIFGTLGGWSALGGLMTAGLAGLWLGLSDTGGVSGYVYDNSGEGWLYGPADIVSLTVAEEGV